MAEEKNSFVLYADMIHTVKKMPKDKAGELLLVILEYVNGLETVVEDMLVDIVFEPIKQRMKRDLIKWEGVKAKRSASGKAGGIKSGVSRQNPKNEPKEASASKGKQVKAKAVTSKPKEASASKKKQPLKVASKNEANEAVNGNVSVNVNVINKEVVVEEGNLPFENFQENEELITPPLLEGAVNEEEKIAAVNFLKSHSMFALIQKQQSLKPPEVIKLFETFYETKSVLREITGKSKDEVLKHFLYWVPKYQTAKSPTTTPKTNKNGTSNNFTPRNRTTAARADELRDDRNLLVDSLRGLLRGTAPKE